MELLAIALLVASVTMQLWAAVIALRLIPLTGRRAAWILIAAAIVLMTVRRLITLGRVLGEGGVHEPDVSAEVVALFISMLMLGGVAGIGLVFRALQRAQEDLRESELRFRTLFEESPVATLEEDLSALRARLADFGSETDLAAYVQQDPKRALELLQTVEVIAVNRAAVEVFRAESPEHLLRSMDQMHTEEIVELLKSSAEHIRAGKHSYDSHSVVRMLDGQRRDIAVKWYVPPGNRSDYSRAFITFVDVTESRELQTRLIIAERMASLGTLAAGVAHEINNPMTFVLGNLHLLGLEIPKGHPSRNNLEDAISGAERVRDIVADLQVFSREDTHSEVAVELDAVLDLSVRITEAHRKSRARLVIEDHPKLMVSGNSSRLSQVFINLLSNAAQAIAPGDADNNEIRVSIEVLGERVVVSIRDTGSGIPRRVKQRIFDPFFTTKSPGDGTGLGLYICKNILSAMKGDLRLLRTGPEGSEFCVTLLCASNESIAQDSRPSSISAPMTIEPRRVLFVDDEPEIRSLANILLDGHAVTLASTGREAIALLERERFDVILCDLMMPDQTGIDVHEFLQREQPQELERLVLVTGGAITDQAHEFLERASVRCILKPFDPDVLLGLVTAATVRER